MATARRTSPLDVFINCPFDDGYAAMFRALLFAVHACGFRPRTARELDDSGQTRIEKLYDLIGECRFGIHDLSRTELDRGSRLPRFNMPLELGIFLGAKRFGGKDQRDKRVLVFDVEPYRYQKFISDLAGMDIHAHGNTVDAAIRETRNWLANVSRRDLPSANKVVRLHAAFTKELPALAKELDFASKSIPYFDFEKMLIGWLQLDK